MNAPDTDEIISAAIRAVDDNVRHSRDSLFELLCEWYPDATDEQIDEALEAAL